VKCPLKSKGWGGARRNCHFGRKPPKKTQDTAQKRKRPGEIKSGKKEKRKSEGNEKKNELRRGGTEAGVSSPVVQLIAKKSEKEHKMEKKREESQERKVGRGGEKGYLRYRKPPKPKKKKTEKSHTKG